MRSISKKSVIVWCLERTTFYLLTLGAASLFYRFFDNYILVEKSFHLLMILLIFTFLRDYIAFPMRYRHFLYQENPDNIFIKKGAFFIKESTVPYKKIQHVDIDQSFYSRIIGLYAVNIYTAGSNHQIEYVKKGEAEKLKKRIIQELMEVGEKENEEETR